MLLALDIGNTTVLLGVFDIKRTEWIPQCRVTLAADIKRTSDEYRMLLANALAISGCSVTSIDCAAIASVVPSLSSIVVDAVQSLCGVTPLIIGPGTRTGLNIRIDQQTQLGADIVANAVAAISLVPSPVIVADLGTATTLAVIDSQSTLIGAIICPGVRTSLGALSDAASQLAVSDLSRPRALVGKNTNDSVLSGVVHGHAYMLDGFIRDLKRQLTSETPISLLATGGNASYILPHTRSEFRYIPDLTLRGIALLYKKNL